MNIYVGNLDPKINDNGLRIMFEQFGEVDTAKVIYDRSTKESRGYGFVEMRKKNEALEAIQTLNGVEFLDKKLIVYKAKEGNTGKSNSIVSGKIRWV